MLASTNIGIINVIDNGDKIGRIFKTQFVLLEQLKTVCLFGYQDIPKFYVFVNDNSQFIQDDK